MTDGEYLKEEDIHDEKELEEWEPDPEFYMEEDNTVGGGRWTAEEMFHANDKLGVRTNYNGIEEYQTAVPEGTEEDRIRAKQIAYEIENNKESQRNRLLENDDEERDLDKETRFSDRDGGRGKRQSSGGYQNK
jgi:hypothetical protein